MAHDPLAGQHLRQAIPRIAARQELDGLTQAEEVVSVLNCFVPDDEASSQLQSLISDLIFRYLIAAAKRIHKDCEGRNFDSKLDDFLKSKTRLTGDNVSAFRKPLKAAVLASCQKRPKRSVRKRYLAQQKHLPCYLCGKAIDETDEKLDHVWPLSAGGGNGNNIRRAHAACEEASADIAVCGDAAVGRFAFKNKMPHLLSEHPEKGQWWPRTLESSRDFFTYADDVRAAQMRIAILRRQNFSCYECETEIVSTGAGALQKKEADEPWWFPNTIFVCNNCK